MEEPAADGGCRQGLVALSVVDCSAGEEEEEEVEEGEVDEARRGEQLTQTPLLKIWVPWMGSSSGGNSSSSLRRRGCELKQMQCKLCNASQTSGVDQPMELNRCSARTVT